MRFILLFLFVILQFSICEANNFRKVEAPSKLKNKNFCIKLPVEINNHSYILTGVKINGSAKTYRFLLDTGAKSCCISSDIATELGINTVFSDSITDGITKKSTDFIFCNLSFNGLKFENVGSSLHKRDELNFGNSCHRIDGIIGYNVMRKLVWSFNKGVITVSDKISLLDDIGEMCQDKISKGGAPLIVAGFVKGFRATMLFDLGDNGVFEVHNDLLQYLRSKKVIEGEGSIFSTIINEITDSVTNKLIKVPGFFIGNDTISNAITYVGNGLNLSSSIGAGILDNMSLVLDFPKRRLYTKLYRKEFNNAKFVNHGFTYKISDNKVLVRFVWDNTKACEAGIKPGLQILKINDLDLAVLDSHSKCEWSLLLEKELSGNELVLKVQGIEEDIVLMKQNLF